MPRVSTEVRSDEQRPIEPRRGNLKAAGVGQQVLDVQNYRELTTDAGAVLNVDAALTIYHHSQYPAAIFEKMTQLDEYAILASSHTFRMRSK